MRKIAIVIATVALTAVSANANEAPTVIDPVTGVEVSISELDMTALTPEQRQDVGDQIRAQKDERSDDAQERHQHRHQERERVGEMGAGMSSDTGGGAGAGMGGAGGGNRP